MSATECKSHGSCCCCCKLSVVGCEVLESILEFGAQVFDFFLHLANQLILFSATKARQEAVSQETTVQED